MSRIRPAFTLVEVLIVVIILAILASIVIPQVTDATTVSRESNLKENLSKIRAQLQVYRNQHNAFPTAADFSDQMTLYTNAAGQTSGVRTGEFRFGPYLEQMPANPISNLRAVRAAAAPDDRFPPGDADGGWWYNEITAAFFADLRDHHADHDGNQYNRY